MPSASRASDSNFNSNRPGRLEFVWFFRTLQLSFDTAMSGSGRGSPPSSHAEADEGENSKVMCLRHPSPRHLPERVDRERGLGRVRVEEAEVGSGGVTDG
eukprot:scaffold15590_cov136-Isochrysis_galbana.AAC.8